MANSPKSNEEKMMEVSNAWKTLAPDKSFGGMTLAEFEAQIEKSLTPRRRLIEIADEEIQQQTIRDTEDAITMGKLQLIVNGVKADPEEGEDGALYDAMGYVRKSERKSGLTRKKNGNAEIGENGETS